MLARVPLSGARSVVVATTGVPGPDKCPPRLERVFAEGLLAVRQHFRRAQSAVAFADCAGPVFVWLDPNVAATTKGELVAIEERLDGGRLLDLDVYDREGRQIGRRDLGLPPRECLLCRAPAVDCARVERHDPKALANAAATIAGRAPHAGSAAGSSFARVVVPPDSDDAAVPDLGTLEPRRLARALAAAAATELRLTPKPGLVDLADTGSHPDLSYDAMELSVALLPRYFTELVEARLSGAGLEACVGIGREAESRMFAVAGANTHKGFIFLAGLLLLAACDGARTPRALREAVASIASAFFQRAAARGHLSSVTAPGPATRVRGVATEALAGLPSVFDVAQPALAVAIANRADLQIASHLAMSRLMQTVDDTTSVRRCGEAGLARIRRDGRTLESLIARHDESHLPVVAAWNRDYRSEHLTMGGVADLLAISLALTFAANPAHLFSIAESAC